MRFEEARHCEAASAPARLGSLADRHLLALLDRAEDGEAPEWAPIVELGLHHEQQHQELILTDIKHAFYANPMRPAYASGPSPLTPSPLPAGWISYPAALREIGHD